jgi:hypothetical protein
MAGLGRGGASGPAPLKNVAYCAKVVLERCSKNADFAAREFIKK